MPRFRDEPRAWVRLGTQGRGLRRTRAGFTSDPGTGFASEPKRGVCREPNSWVRLRTEDEGIFGLGRKKMRKNTEEETTVPVML
ncbi:hypothetical protein SLEP1_g2665 [Rubroshorea leprosula]|uniref:Uncharacterized protein n=1 Tax=Rubroshorea leprosula TaxID=152421 RepID=A0AAV5HQ73_9ROSI|nr:hypothetical protein SLEP1_g2665 [Rubroshorea leprosula]